jgi:hypothetical protein
VAGIAVEKAIARLKFMRSKLLYSENGKKKSPDKNNSLRIRVTHDILQFALIQVYDSATMLLISADDVALAIAKVGSVSIYLRSTS